MEEPDQEIGHAASKVAFQALKEEHGHELDVEVLHLTSRTFHSAKVAPNHVAGEAFCEGAIMNGKRPNFLLRMSPKHSSTSNRVYLLPGVTCELSRVWKRQETTGFRRLSCPVGRLKCFEGLIFGLIGSVS